LEINPSNNPPIRWGDFEWHAEQVALLGGIFQITFMPVSIGNTPQSILDEIAQRCLQINSKGVPMFIRYGHEMNADWLPYGMKPIEYKREFIQMSETIRKYTNLTGIVSM
jgi:hypothetical protein